MKASVMPRERTGGKRANADCPAVAAVTERGAAPVMQTDAE